MHPAVSVIFFTTATGAGYGLLALLGLLSASGAIPPDRSFGAVALGVALLLIIAGLMSSMAHLGRPERAWRAFSQWRSSWLSREGVASVATFVPAGLFAGDWLVLGQNTGVSALLGVVAGAFALATVATTGMIYASLKPIAQWHSAFTLPSYLVFSVMTGAVLLNALLSVFGVEHLGIELLAAFAIVVGWALKAVTWRHNDRIGTTTTINSATGLMGGTVRSIEWPHTEENYLLKAMGYQLARKHSARLRRFVHVFAFALPLALTLTALVAGTGIATAATLGAAVCQALGILAERWLFFAEAKHTIVLYYGRPLE